MHCSDSKEKTQIEPEELCDPKKEDCTDVDHLIVKVITDYNIDAVIKQKAILTLECLVR